MFLFSNVAELLLTSLLKNKLKDFSSPILKGNSYWVRGNFVLDTIINKMRQTLKRGTKNSVYFSTALKK